MAILKIENVMHTSEMLIIIIANNFYSNGNTVLSVQCC